MYYIRIDEKTNFGSYAMKYYTYSIINLLQKTPKLYEEFFRVGGSLRFHIIENNTARPEEQPRHDDRLFIIIIA